MPPQVDQLRRRASSTFSGFSSGQKAVSAIAVVGLLIVGYFFMGWASKPSYAPLFSNLSASDASAMTSKLASQHVSYQLADGGQTILVPQNKVYQTRINMSAAGLPSGGTQGYSLLDKQGITTSDFVQHIDYQRALEGELTKTIDAIQGVQGARVHLVMPTDDVFATSSQKATASVLLETAPGAIIPASTGQAIVHLVATSVPGLDPSAVTVADTAGDILSATGSSGQSLAAGGTDMTQTKSYEDGLAASLTRMLNTVLGPNHAVVQVSADLDFSQRQTTTESFPNATPAPAVSETTDSESFNGTGASQQAAGVLATTPTANTATAGTAGDSYKKDQATRTYAVPKVTDQVNQAPGTLKRLSVAVALDSSAKGADKATVAQLISAAAGITPSRGDTVAVDVLPFDTTAAKQASKDLKAAASAQSMTGMVSMAKTGVLLLAVLGVLFVLLRSSKRQAVRVPLAIPHALAELEPGPAPATYELVGAGARSSLAADRGSAPLPAIIHDAGRASISSSGAPPELANLIDHQPDEVAHLLRGWLGDRRS